MTEPAGGLAASSTRFQAFVSGVTGDASGISLPSTMNCRDELQWLSGPENARLLTPSRVRR